MKHANFLYTSELEGVMSTCFKALESSNYDVRVCVAQLIGTLMAMTQQIPSATVAGGKNKKTWSLEEVFSYMSGGFLRGGIGFLKGSGGELLKSIAPREVRVGVTQVIQMRVRTLLIITGSALVYGQFPPGDMATGNHGSCIGQNKYPVQTQHPKHQAIRSIRE